MWLDWHWAVVFAGMLGIGGLVGQRSQRRAVKSASAFARETALVLGLYAVWQYAGRMSLDDEARVIGAACGAFGSSLDYFLHTREALARNGIVDRYVERLHAKLALAVATPARPAPIASEEPPR